MCSTGKGDPCWASQAWDVRSIARIGASVPEHIVATRSGRSMDLASSPISGKRRTMSAKMSWGRLMTGRSLSRSAENFSSSSPAFFLREGVFALFIITSKALPVDDLLLRFFEVDGDASSSSSSAAGAALGLNAGGTGLIGHLSSFSSAESSTGAATVSLSTTMAGSTACFLRGAARFAAGFFGGASPPAAAARSSSRFCFRVSCSAA
mmetsp:Transcript_18048/g.58918  ORF Transcript_18048/g.58918 Transcript_18048/m.58918 type:complete len:208 (+) Transcript_18048:1786-2409(+)